MTDDKINIDKLYKDEFQDFKIESSPDNIRLFNKTVNKFNFMKFGFSSFNIYYLIIVVGIIIFGTIFINSQILSNKPQKKHEIIITDSKSESEEKIINIDQNNIESNSNDSKHINTITDTYSKTTNKNMNPVDNQNEIDSVLQNKESSMDTTVIIIHDTVIIEKKIIITDTIKTVIHKDNNNP